MLFIFAIIIIIMFFSLPIEVSIAMTLYLCISALVIQTVASYLAKSKIRYSDSMKAILYSLVFFIIAAIFGFKLIDFFGPTAVYVLPVLAFLSQGIAYSIALDLPLFGSILLSIIITCVGWILKTIFGLSFIATTKFISLNNYLS